MMPRIIAAGLRLGGLFCRPVQFLRKLRILLSPKRITSASGAFDSFFRRLAFISKEEFAQLALQEKEPRMEVLAVVVYKLRL